MFPKIFCKALTLIACCLTAVCSSSQACSSVCEAAVVEVDTWATEQGNLSNPLYEHSVSVNSSGGSASSNGAQIQCGVTVAASALSCLKVLGCHATISFNTAPFGVGTTVVFPPSNIWAAQYSQVTVCAAKTGPVGSCVKNDFVDQNLWNASGNSGHSTLNHAAYSTLSGECFYADQGSGGDGGGGGCESNGDCEPHTCCDVTSGTCSASACGQQGETRHLSKSWHLVEPGGTWVRTVSDTSRLRQGDLRIQ